MTKYYFSASTLGLYVSSIHKTLPQDAKEITESRYSEVIGKVLSADANGFPVIILPAEKTLDDLKLNKISEIENQRNIAIEQSVTSSALGSNHTYSAKRENRQFLNDLITLGNGGKFTCTDSNNIKARCLHTHAQLLVLAHDIEAHVSAQFDHYETKLTAIDAANTQAELEAVVW